MNSYNPSDVINGTFGQLWIDDEMMAEVTSLEAKITLEKSDVNQTGTLAKGKKIVGSEGKGTIKLNKVTSYFIKLLGDDMKKGVQSSFTVTSKLADPNSKGEEKVVLKGCTFDELTLANWEAKKLCEDSIPFDFVDFDVVDMIE